MDVVDTDAFLEMSSGAQLLYYNLGMRADDDGFVGAPKKIMRNCRATEGDMKELLREGFIIAFQSGIVVITHWRQNNFIRSDRYKPTRYLDEKQVLGLNDNGVYGLLAENPQLKALPSKPLVAKADTEPDTSGIPDGIPTGIPDGNHPVNQRDTQYRLGEDRLDKVSLDKVKEGKNNGASAPTNRKRFMRPSIQEIQEYCTEKGYTHVDAEYFWNYYENINWHVGKNKMKSWKLAVANWEKRQIEFERQKGAAANQQTGLFMQHTEEEKKDTWGWD